VVGEEGGGGGCVCSVASRIGLPCCCNWYAEW